MHIGLVVPGDLSTATGGFVYDRQLADHLRRQGDTVEVIQLPGRSYARRLAANLDPRVGRRLDRPVDLLVEDELCHPSLLWDRRPDVPRVALVHHLLSSEPRRLAPVYRLAERRYLQGIHGVVCSSETTSGTVKALVDKTSVLVARPAGDRLDPDLTPGAVEARAREPGPLRVIFLGRVTPRKGLEPLVRGLAQLPAGTWRLVAIGDLTADRGYAKRVRRLAHERGVGSNVRLAGQLPDAAVADELARSHLLAVPSRYEGFGIAYLEGMGFGLPALATKAGGAGEVVTEGVTGWLVPPDDPWAVAAAVGTVLDDRERLASMGCAALARYDAHPSWADTAEQIRSYLERLHQGFEPGRPIPDT